MPSRELVIGQRDRQALEALTLLDNNEYQQVVELLQKERQSFTRDELAKEFAASVSSLSEDTAGRILGALLSVEAIRNRTDFDMSTAVQLTAKVSALELTPQQRDVLSARLTELIELPTLYQFAKAFDVLSERERHFHSARVITDVRPVFPENAAEGPMAVIITQTLKLEYTDGAGQLQSIFIGLDSADLRALRIALERSQEKIGTLKQVIGATGLPILRIEENGNGMTESAKS